MAVYKVIQDVEAEDKLLGPLTFKGFIYALIAGTSAFIEIKLLFIGSPLKWIFIIIFGIPMLLFGVLASPLGGEQPTEVWLLSRVRFFLKPRKRIWDQEGMSELVTITAPKKEELHLTKDITQTEVQSRLKTLASTLDTRGWAIKNVDVNLDLSDSNAQLVTPDSDRLVGASGVPRQMAVVDVHAADDIMDEKNNPTAKKFDTLMKQAEDKRKRSLLASLKGLVNEKPAASKGRKGSVKSKKATAHKDSQTALTEKDKEFLRQSKAEAQRELEAKLAKARAKFNAEHAGEKTKKESPEQKQTAVSEPKAETAAAAAKPKTPSSKPVTPDSQSVKMELAQSGNAFSVATLSQLANRPKVEQTGPDEVTISLH